MTLRGYLQEDGAGAYASHRVPDLLPPLGGAVDLLILLESPHTEELDAGVPIAGGSGRAAIAFLRSTFATPDALGPFVKTMHVGGDFRVGVINVCELPLQRAAFGVGPAPLSSADWELLRRVRVDPASLVDSIKDFDVRSTSQLLLAGLQARVDAITFSPGASAAMAGKFAQRFWRSLPRIPQVTPLPVPHPSNGWWTRLSNSQNHDNLAELRRLFKLHTS